MCAHMMGQMRQAHHRYLRARYGRLVGGTDEDSLEIWAKVQQGRGGSQKGWARPELSWLGHIIVIIVYYAVPHKVWQPRGGGGLGLSTKLECDP